MKRLRKTKIVGTIGPASENKLEELFEAGLNVCRINYSHGSWDEQSEKSETIARLREKLDLPIPMLLDMKGPEIRTGMLYTGKNTKIQLKDGQKFTLVNEDITGDEEKVSVTYKELYKDVKVKKEFNNLGEKGSYTIKDYNDNERNNVPIEGYKLPLKNIRDVKTYAYGQAGMSGIFVFIDKENNASIMKIDYDYNSEDKIVVKDINLYKNVANNIISSIDYNGEMRNFFLIDKDNNYYTFSLN